MNERVGIIGCGNMGGAIARALSDQNAIFLFDRGGEKGQKLAEEIEAQRAPSVEILMSEVDVVILAVKPQGLEEVGGQITPYLNQNHVIVSVLAGISLEAHQKVFPNSTIISAMPNTAITTKNGTIGFVEDCTLESAVKRRIEVLFSPCGLLVWVPQDKMGGLTAISGCGPAFVLEMIDAMVSGAIAAGLPADLASILTLKTFEGAVSLLRDTGKHPGQLQQEIASPGGTTIEGLRTMVKENVASGVIEAVIAAYKKCGLK